MAADRIECARSRKKSVAHAPNEREKNRAIMHCMIGNYLVEASLGLITTAGMEQPDRKTARGEMIDEWYFKFDK